MNNFDLDQYKFNLISEFKLLNLNTVNPDPDYIKREFGEIPLILNKDGYRSPELTNVDFVFTGCSQTFGIGLEEKFIWGKDIATKNNWTYNNLGVPGDSVFNIIFSLFKYFNQYGNPKHLICLFPDFSRTRVYLDDIIHNVNGKINQFFSISHNPFDEFVETKNKKNNSGLLKRNKYIKLPTHPENILSYPNELYFNLTYIKILEQYCKSNNINFAWSTWTNINEEKDFLFEIFEYFLKIEIIGLDELNCHEENKNNLYFDMAYDNTHLGIHANLHISENFMKVINDNTWN